MVILIAKIIFIVAIVIIGILFIGLCLKVGESDKFYEDRERRRRKRWDKTIRHLSDIYK